VAVADLDRGSGTPKAVSNEDLIAILSGVDYVPTEPHIHDILGDSAPADLRNIARDETEDAGLRIRAYRALALYPSGDTESFLEQQIPEHGRDGDGNLTTTGIDTVYLRAAMHSMAIVAGGRGVNHIGPMLDHDVRDVRAAAARALATCGSPVAIPLLRDRHDVEKHLQNPSKQVLWALEEAIRTLSEGT